MGDHELKSSKADKLARYWKTVVAVLGAVLVIGNEVAAVAVEGYGDGIWTGEDTTTVLFVLLTALGVYLKANKKAPVTVEVPTYGDVHADFSDPMRDPQLQLHLDGPAENLIGMDTVSFTVVKKV